MSIATPNSSTVVSQDWHSGFLAVLPTIQAHAQIQFRHMRPERREDAIQEAIASACRSYYLLAAKGRLHDAHASTLAKFAVNHVRNGRHIGGSQESSRDLLSPVAQSRFGFETNSLDPIDNRTAGWRQIAVEDRRTPVPDLAAFRIDFPAWLRSQTRRHRRIIAALINGGSTSAVAKRFCLSEGRISQLRRKFELDWHRYHGSLASGKKACA